MDASRVDGATPFPIVGIGAGPDAGLDGCEGLLCEVSRQPGSAVILVQGSAAVPRHGLVPATDGMRVEPDRAYLVPRDSIGRLERGSLRIAPADRMPASHLPVEHLFRSLADHAGRPIGVLLGCVDADGVQGLREIRHAGGVTVSTRPLVDPMDGASLTDLVVEPAGLAARLADLATDADEEDLLADELVSAVLSFLRSMGGEDFTDRRREVVHGRARRRMWALGIRRFGAYLDRLADDPAERRALQRDLRSRADRFFHDPALLDAVGEVVSEQLQAASDSYRAWVPSCGFGEEAYTLAISLTEWMARARREVPVKLLATDTDGPALDLARGGVYPAGIELDVHPERLDRSFVGTPDGYAVEASLRRSCVFANHDAMRDPPFSKVDLVFCRRHLGRLEPAAGKDLLARLHYSLKPGGLLVLGEADPVPPTALFDRIDPGRPVYRRVAGPSAPWAGSPEPRRVARRDAARRELQGKVDRMLRQTYAPPGVVIDDHWTVRLWVGDAASLLGTQGFGRTNLARVLPAPLVPELRRLVALARAERARVTGEAVEVGALYAPRSGAPDAPRSAHLEVAPVHHDEGACWLVTFHLEAPNVPASLHPDPTRIRGLEQEAEDARRRARATEQERLEELESSREQVRSLEEEFQVTYEELRLANDRVQLVNDELERRNLMLASINDEIEDLFGGVEIPIVMVGLDLRVRRATAVAEQVFRVRPADVGRPFQELSPSLELQDLTGAIEEVIASRVPSVRDVRDATGRWYSLRIRPLFSHGGRIDGATLVALDIDLLKRSLDQLDAARRGAEAVVDAVRHPLVVVDDSLRVVRSNPAFEDLVRADVHELLGLSTSRPGASLSAWLRAVVEGDSPSCEVGFEGPEGESRTVRMHGGPIDWPDAPSARAWLLAIEDVSEQKREVERARQLAAEQSARIDAEAANRAKDEFLAMLAHELRNPLAPLQSAIRILRRGPTEGAPPTDWTLAMADRQVRHLARLVDDLLDASRLTQNKIVPRMEPIDLLDALRRVLDVHRRQIRKAGQLLEVEMPDDPIWVLADPTRIEQIFTNILQNAIKYSPPDGRLRVRVEEIGSEVAVSVADEGLGLDPELLPHVFDLFVQGHRALDRSMGGLGIGLTIVRRLVEMHGGTVEAHSAGPGKGSEFVVRLPVQPPPSRDQGAERHEPQSAVVVRDVLVVDDNRDAADTLSILLRSAGHRVRTRYDGPSALQAVEEERPDVVLLDIGLPGMDGFEVATELRRRLGDRMPVVVALTGYGDEKDRERSAAAGFHRHFVKPIEASVLDSLLLDPLRASAGGGSSPRSRQGSEPHLR